MCDLPDVPERVAHHRPPIAVWRIERRLERDLARGEGEPIHLVRVVDIDVEKRRNGWRAPAAGTMTSESPMRILAGR